MCCTLERVCFICHAVLVSGGRFTYAVHLGGVMCHTVREIRFWSLSRLM